MNKEYKLNLSFHPLTLDKWKDFENLFGEKGACAGCWCMYWFMNKKEYDEKRKDGRTKKEMKRIVKDKIEPGIIAYDMISLLAGLQFNREKNIQNYQTLKFCAR